MNNTDYSQTFTKNLPNQSDFWLQKEHTTKLSFDQSICVTHLKAQYSQLKEKSVVMIPEWIWGD